MFVLNFKPCLESVTFLVQWLYAYRIYKFGTSSDVVSLTIGSSLPQVLGLVIVLVCVHADWLYPFF